MENITISPTTAFEPRKHLEKFYSNLYRGDANSDSPEQTKTSLLARSVSHIFSLREEDVIMDIGSGPQIIPRQLYKSYGPPKCKIVTVDMADIPEHKLLMKNRSNVTHVKADGSRLPFGNETFSLAVSNMALDLMPKETISELYRVSKPDSRAFLNLHHPLIIPENLDELLSDPRIKKGQKRALVFWQYLKRNNILFKNQTEIENAFVNAGFSIINIKEAGNSSDKWWEVDLVKR